MLSLYAVATLGLVVSFVLDRGRTKKAVKIAGKKLAKILPGYLKILMILSVVLLIPNALIVRFIGENSSLAGLFIGATFGSITMMPGFIAYPLSGVLVEQGVSYMVVAAFVTTLMMVGVATYPVEKQYFGTRATIVRNVVGFLIALVIAIAVGLFYGELI